MTLHQLPERANLEQLKKQAKSLLAAARSQEPNAIQRFEAVLIGRSLKPDAIALHDAQFVLAREYGFKSWNDLKDQVEERLLSFSAAVDEFLRCATGSAPERAMRLWKRHAGIAHGSFRRRRDHVPPTLSQTPAPHRHNARGERSPSPGSAGRPPRPRRAARILPD